MYPRKFIRSVALSLGLLMSATVGAAGFYDVMLPGRYFLSAEEELTIDSLLPITAREENSSFALAQNDLTTRSAKTTENTLLLFGAVPVKTVTSTTSERPTLLALGTPFGIKLTTQGVMVVDVEPQSPGYSSGLAVGDIIVSVNSQDIHSNSQLSQLVRQGETCDVDFTRDGELFHTTLTPQLQNGTYKAGVWVRDSSAGIGTMTFCDPSTGAFGGLGHGVCDADTKKLMPLDQGQVCGVKLTAVQPSEKGDPGQLMGEFNDSLEGTLTANCEKGVFGTLAAIPQGKTVELGFKQEIKKGPAAILTTLDDSSEPREYSIEIEQVELSRYAEHDLVIRVTDPELLREAGGIVQGMSGSPVIQDGRLVGAVTHVFVDDPTKGYGIFAEEMVTEAVNRG